MNEPSLLDRHGIPAHVNYITKGDGAPVILVHGLAASLHDWDALVPQLVASGYAVYAPDLLGHGDSPKPPLPSYEMEWMVGHFMQWLEGLHLAKPVVLIGHSLGGFVVLEYARRLPQNVRALVLVDPFYSNDQLPLALRIAYSHPKLSGFFLTRSPRWLVRAVIDATSMLMGHRGQGAHALSAAVRAQTASDYLRTAPAAYGMLNARLDLSPHLATISAPSLVIWGEGDHTLAPASFLELVRRLPQALGKSSRTGHVPHQADADWFAAQVLDFLKTLPGR